MTLLVLLKDLQVAVQVAINIEGQLRQDKQFLLDLNVIVKSAKKGFTNATGGALHRLHETKPSIETVKKLIQGTPDALSFKIEEDQLVPI